MLINIIDRIKIDLSQISKWRVVVVCYSSFIIIDNDAFFNLNIVDI
jgi:hypothetical protein